MALTQKPTQPPVNRLASLEAMVEFSTSAFRNRQPTPEPPAIKPPPLDKMKRRIHQLENLIVSMAEVQQRIVETQQSKAVSGA